MIRLRLYGVAALTAVAMAGGVGAWMEGSWKVPVLAGIGLAYLLAIPSYLSLSVVFNRSDKAFFSVLAGGMLVRLTALVISVLAVHRFGPWPVAPFAISAAGGLMMMTLLELFFFSRQNRLWTSSTRSNTISSTTSSSV